MLIDDAVGADITCTRENNHLTLAAHVHAGRSRVLTWRLWAEVESRGGRSTTQQAGLTNGLQTAPVCTIQFNDDVIGIVELEVGEDNVRLAHHQIELSPPA